MIAFVDLRPGRDNGRSRGEAVDKPPARESDTNRRSRAYRDADRTRCPSHDKERGMRVPECRAQPNNDVIIDPSVTLRVISDRLCCIGDRQPMLGPRVLHY
ncbi:hypothetical protein Ais01nite_76500 [Asanoa ishikariensis]|nr:hypothetical protein Ais01nite_76500 [Asanoa ishikariensis]